MKPIVDGIEQQYSWQIAVKRINAEVDDGPTVMRDYHIPGHPTTLIYDSDGKEVQRLPGPQSAEAIETILQKVTDDAQN